MIRVLEKILCVITLHMFWCVSGILAQQAPSAAEMARYQKQIADCSHAVNTWHWHSNLQITFVIAVILCGALITIFQGMNRGWTKPTTLALGAVTTILTSVNAKVFTADYRVLQQSVIDGQELVDQMSVIFENLSEPQADVAGLRSQWFATRTKFSGLEKAVLQGTAAQGTSKTMLLDIAAGTAYAQSSTPAWFDHSPKDDFNLYFAGTAEDRSVTSARQASFDDAVSKAVASQSRSGADPETLRKLISSSAVVEKSGSNFDKSRGLYRFWTLLRISKEITNIGPLQPANAAPPRAALTFRKNGWRPSDMTSDPASGIFVLDRDGSVYRLAADPQGPQITTLFRLKGAYQGLAVAAGSQAVYALAASKLGCSVTRYSLVDSSVKERLITGEKCAGIATDGTTLYVTLPQTNEVLQLRSWNDSTAHRWNIAGAEAVGYITFDRVANRLIGADYAGKAYAISTSDGAKQLLATNLGWVNSLAGSRQHILVASGTKILSLARSGNRGENPPLSLQTLTGGHIVGVAVDANDKAWFADYDGQLVKGPLPVD